MTTNTIQTVLIIGAGTMGLQIGLQCATHGYQVMLYDIDESKLDSAMQQLKVYVGQLTESGRLTQIAMNEAIARIRTTTDPETAAQADLVSESVPEDPALKGKVFAQFNQLCPPHTIFTTNSSSLVPSMFAEATGRPQQFAALHFHQLVWDSPVVDVMPHPGTAPEVVEQLIAFARSIDQIPIVLEKENHGYVFNAMLNALNSAALSLASREITSIENIDRAWMGVMKTDIGPMGILDLVGLDTAWHITNYWATTLQDADLRRNADFLRQYVDKGWLGVKTGQGFYNYPEPAYGRNDFVNPQNVE